MLNLIFNIIKGFTLFVFLSIKLFYFVSPSIRAADVPNSIGNIEMVDQQTEPGQPEIQQEGEQRKEPEADNTVEKE